MRIISQPVSAAQLRPVEAPQGLRNRVARDSAPEAHRNVSDGVKAAAAAPAAPAQGGAENVLSAGDTAMVRTGVTAQKVFHAVYGGPAEASLPEANRAYTKTDSLRFTDVPFTLRVV